MTVILQIALRRNKFIKYVNSLQKSKTKTKQEVKWDTIIEMYSNSIDWNQAYIFPFSTTSDTVLSFQYKILHRLPPTNKYVFTCKLKKLKFA